jgi:hypothetical protein
VKGSLITGIAKDSSNDIASLLGSINSGTYNITVHSLENVDDSSQDIVFHGTRDGSEINGSWRHSVGVTGTWSASLTTLSAKETTQPFIKSCDEKIINRQSDGKTCANSA